jgi:hypothetical protein
VALPWSQHPFWMKGFSKRENNLKIVDLNFLIEELIPPIGGTLKYAAKVQFLYVEDNSGRRKVKHDFGETWGRTKDEATEKMQKMVDSWLTGAG